MTDRRFHVIDGTPAPDTPAEQVRKRVRAMPKPATMPQCPRCGGREYIETKIGAGRSATKQRLCVLCLMKGERVIL
ncbi:hypothetical protein [Pseudomonas sp. zfem003]|uniref:hypothetical protein n=1 Tax=Pseudomonas sp. zfem003 TaxID=3078198 RepID=UPI0029292976|nr:hypothetical protein [Pseudomonas sp. zfem003]MDU9398037.1 hypothetical protein [Pseudomonas sp. zfem003]